jgi:hypothetical protein
MEEDSNVMMFVDKYAKCRVCKKYDEIRDLCRLRTRDCIKCIKNGFDQWETEFEEFIDEEEMTI